MDNHFSLSQARTALACPLQWWYSRQGERNQPEGPALQGNLLDDLITGWVQGPAAYCEDEEVWQDFFAIRDNILGDYPKGEAQVMVNTMILGVPIPVLGFADYVEDDCVTDWKRGGGWDQAWWDAAKRQVALYAGALGKSMGRIVQVRDGRLVTLDFAVTPELVAEVHEEIRRGWVMASSFEDAEVCASPGKSCSWCDFEPRCPQSVFRTIRAKNS